MRAKPPSSFLLNGRTGWRLVDDARRPAEHQEAIRLPGDPAGPLSLNSPDGSLGGLVLPRGFAVDQDDTLYILIAERARIRRFNPGRARFVTVRGVGGVGSDAREFSTPTNIAIAGGHLYVADTGNRRVQVFTLNGLVLRHLWRTLGRSWEPADIVSDGRRAYILDRENGAVYAHQPGDDQLRRSFEIAGAANRWTRIAVDRAGLIYLLDPSAPRLQVYAPDGTPGADITDSSQAAAQFDPPGVRLDHRERFCLPATLALLCRRSQPSPAITPEEPLAACGTSDTGKAVPLLFDRQGDPATREPAEALGPRLYRTNATWFSEPLDSRIARCQWHRIEMALDALPPGTRVVVSTHASEKPVLEESERLREHTWSTPPFTVTGAMQSRRGASTASTPEFLIQSRTGRFLWIRIQLSGDGFSSPVVSSLRIHFPREGYLEYLPAVYRQDPESAWFLERFLSLPQTEWDGLERRVTDIAAYFDPKAVPSGPFLTYLARWLALPLEETWGWDQKRLMLEAAPRFYQRRGTRASLDSFLRAYLRTLSGLSAAQAEAVAYPQLVESFRERTYLMLNRDHVSSLGGQPTWSAGVVARCHLGVFSTEGEVRMIATGDPEHDLFQQSAHRFRVFVPAAWVRSIDDERKLRRAIDAEKPLHTRYDLCLIEPRFRVGIQSTVGVNTVVGTWPVAQLACRHDTDVPSSREPAHRLGYDMVLGSARTHAGVLQLQPDARMGIDTGLT